MTADLGITTTTSISWDVAPADPPLAPGEVHVWAAITAGRTDGIGVLTADECARAARFRFERDRVRWTAARVLLRRVLARYLGCAPEVLVVRTRGPREKPSIHRPRRSAWLRFNLAHAGDLAVVAVANRCEVGVDVELVTADRDVLGIARRVFPAPIVHELAGVPDEARVERFYRAWVRQEARAKCLGTGLVEPNEDASPAVPLFDLDLGIGCAGAIATAKEPVRIRRWHLPM